MEIRRKGYSAVDGMLNSNFNVFMDIYFTYFRLLTLFGVSSILAIFVQQKLVMQM